MAINMPEIMKDFIIFKCTKCGHIASFIMLKNKMGYCMCCCKTIPLEELIIEGGDYGKKYIY